MTLGNTQDYKENLLQVSKNLTNALNTFGSQSQQYQAILEMLQDCLRRIDSDRGQTSRELDLDPDLLSVAMGFLEIGK